jgi:hypothetical protein
MQTLPSPPKFPDFLETRAGFILVEVFVIVVIETVAKFPTAQWRTAATYRKQKSDGALLVLQYLSQHLS